MNKIFLVVVCIASITSCKKDDNSGTTPAPNTVTPSKPTTGVTTWANSSDRDKAFQSWVEYNTQTFMRSSTFTSQNGYTGGQNDTFVAFCINNSGFTPGAFDTSNPGGNTYNKDFDVYRWTSKPFIGPMTEGKSYVYVTRIDWSKTNQTVSTYFFYFLDDNGNKITTLPTSTFNRSLSALKGVFNY